MNCKKCGVLIDEDEPSQNGMCVDCFAEDWGELVEISPIVSPENLLRKNEELKMNEMKKLLEELPEATIDGVFRNEKLTEAVTRYCKDIHSSLILKGFSSDESFQLTKIIINRGYMNSNK